MNPVTRLENTYNRLPILFMYREKKKYKEFGFRPKDEGNF